MADAVLEALSDVFDDMTRQILNRKKEKAGAPQKLIQAVSLVVATTQRLENIALQLAKDEYEDWPQIFGEIEAAAKSVKEGGLLMGKATEALQKGDDSVAAWDEVGVSVGIMVQKTMLLLDIVYGSEVKVLNLISAQALSALEELDGKSAACSKDMSDDDVDNLIAAASGMAKAMKPVAEKLMQRANSEPSDSQAKVPLQSRAKSVLEKTNHILQAANALAQKPEDHTRKTSLQKAIEDLHRDVSPLCSNLAKLIPRVKKAANDVAKSPRKLAMGKGNPGESDPSGKNYKIVQPIPWDKIKDPERIWPKLRHVEPNDRPQFGPVVPEWANRNLRSGNGTLPFLPEDPPLPWPVHLNPYSIAAFEEPYSHLQVFMAPAATLDALSHLNHALDSKDAAAIDELLKRVEEFRKKVSPGIGSSAFKAIKKELDGFRALAAADPSKARQHLTRALQQSSASSDRGPIKFKPIEQLPPFTETPFKWPTLRHWVGESLVTLHDEVEAALVDWEQLEKAGKDTSAVKSYVLFAMDCLHDVIAPKLGLDSATIVRNVSISVNKLAQEKKPDFPALQNAIWPLVLEANLLPAWLAKLRARNAAKRLLSDKQAELSDVLRQVRAAVSEIPDIDRKRVFELIDQILAFSDSNNADSLLKAADQLANLLRDLLLRNLIPSDLLSKLFSVVNKQPSARAPAVSPRKRGFDSVARRAAELNLKIAPSVKGSKLLDDSSPIVLQTRQIGHELARYAEAAMKNDGAELLAASKELGRLAKPLSTTLSKMSVSSNRDVQDRLRNITKSLNTIPTQIRILTNVKLSSNDKHGHEQLLQMVEALSESLVDVIPTVNAHILSE